jgi:hypothetical protein
MGDRGAKSQHPSQHVGAGGTKGRTAGSVSRVAEIFLKRDEPAQVSDRAKRRRRGDARSSTESALKGQQLAARPETVNGAPTDHPDAGHDRHHSAALDRQRRNDGQLVRQKVAREAPVEGSQAEVSGSTAVPKFGRSAPEVLCRGRQRQE